MIDFTTVVGLLFLVLYGWLCTRSPLQIAKFLNGFYGDPDSPMHPDGHPEFAACVREHPESWHLYYPRVFRIMRLTGWLAFGTVAFGILLIYLASIGLAKGHG